MTTSAVIMYDPYLEEVAAGISDSARRRLVPMLGEVFNVLDNMEVLCPNMAMYCREYVGFKQLRSLLVMLNREVSVDPFSDSAVHPEALAAQH